MEKGKNDGKEIYRKKAFSGKIVRNLQNEYDDFIEEFRKILKEPPSLIFDFLTEKFGTPVEEKKSDLKIIVFFCRNDDLRKILIDLGNRGANLTTIWDVLRTPDIDEYLINEHPVGLQLHEGELSPYWNDTIKNFYTKRREFLKKEKATKNAIRLITALKPITLKHFYMDELPWVNTKLLMAQRELNELNRVIDIYLNAKAIEDGLEGYPAKWGMPINKLVREKFKPLTQRSHKIWDQKIVILVDELKRIVYSNKQAYIKTGELLNLAFPHLYKDKNPDLVRQRYTQQTKK
jgi:hypothetical protein